MNDGLTHFVGDTCEGGHRPARSTSADKMIWRAPEHVAVAVVISQEQYERYEAVVEAARSYFQHHISESPHAPHAEAVTAALAALDGLQNRSDTGTKAQSSSSLQAEKPARSCPNAVSWCDGPDRYGDTCAACLATWTEEAKEKAK